MVNLIYDNRPTPFLTAPEAFWIATYGNAKILQLDGKIGSLEKNKEADIVVIATNSSFDFYNNHNSAENILENLIYLPHTYTIEKVFVRGKLMDLVGANNYLPHKS